MAYNRLVACKGKSAIPSRALADRIARRMMEGGRCRVMSYKCPICRQWHVGNVPPKRPRFTYYAEEPAE